MDVHDERVPQSVMHQVRSGATHCVHSNVIILSKKANATKDDDVHQTRMGMGTACSALVAIVLALSLLATK